MYFCTELPLLHAFDDFNTRSFTVASVGCKSQQCPCEKLYRSEKEICLSFRHNSLFHKVCWLVVKNCS